MAFWQLVMGTGRTGSGTRDARHRLPSKLYVDIRSVVLIVKHHVIPH
jgi:hypothetical protein